MDRAKILNSLFNAVMVFLLTLIYSLMATYLLPEGINETFVSSLWKRLLLPIPPLLFVLGLYVFFFQKRSLNYTKSFESIRRQDWLFALIPMLPVLQYIIANKEMLNIVSSVQLFFPLAVLSITVCVLIPTFLSFLAKKHFLIAGSTAFLFSILNMASLSSMYNWTGEGELGIQLAVFFVFLFLLGISGFLPRKLVSTIIVLVFTVNVVMTGMGANSDDTQFKEKKPQIEDNAISSQLNDLQMNKKRDILLIVYESYAPYETIKNYGFDNKRQMEYLENQGFFIYQGVYTLNSPSTASLTALFNLDPSYPVKKESISGSNVVKQVLGKQNYQTHYVTVNDYMYRDLNFDQIEWDYPFPQIERKKQFSSEVSLILKGILKGEFSDGISLEGVGYDQYLKRKRKVLAGEYPSPLFMYSHSKYPGHGPSGMGFAPSELQKYLNQYMDGLVQANKEMREDIEILLRNNPEALVIVAGDHSPYLSKDGAGLNRRGNFEASDVNRNDVQSRYGAFLAIRWPEPEYAQRYDIQTLQDIFPAVFAYLYGDDTLFEKLRMDRTLISTERILGVTVRDGIIVGGKDSGGPLFLHDGE